MGIVPTETVYGLVCRYSDEAARQRIYAIKGRPELKPLQALIADAGELLALGVEPSALFAKLQRAYWPGALTIVAPVIGGEGTVGVRMPDHAFLRELIRAVGEPLAATSANPAGVAPDSSAAADFMDLAEPPDFVVRGFCGQGAASTVVAVLGDKLEVLREGATPAAAINELAN